MPLVKVADIVHVAYRCPDLDLMERFLTDFGLVRSARTERALYMRGASTAHHVHITYLAETAGLDHVAFAVRDGADLDRLAAMVPGASPVEPLDEPGGGRRVRLRDPDGYRIDVAHGVATLPERPMRPPLTLNFAREKVRRGAAQRPTGGPAEVLRLGHVLLGVRDFERSAAWYADVLGFKFSDVLGDVASGKRIIGFMRCDRGADFADHHTLAFAEAPEARIHHASFEVQDLDAQFLGQQHLTAQGWRHVWGIGRHVIGSQIFDYWRDPFGNMVEHYADGDVFAADAPASFRQIGPEMLAMWGPAVPADFLE
jgi:catechol 2,3-dioxygenase-like lactoylglutathione lyase family enzyme